MLLYVCEPCGASIQETANTSSIQSTPLLSSTSTQVTQTKTATSTDQNPIQNIPHSTQRPKINEEEIYSNQQIDNSPKLVCHHYKQGRCWHGKSGQKIYNGRKCLNLHPRKCLTYCRFGYDQSKGGCSGNCGLLHPTLCRNSLRYKMCFIENCTFTHLAGTERHQQNLQSPYQQNASHNIPKSFSHNNYDQRFIQPPNVQYSAYSNHFQQSNPKKHRG